MSVNIQNSITNFQYLTGIIEHISLNNTSTHIDAKAERNIEMDYDDIFINKTETDLYGQISLILSLNIHNMDESGISINYKFKGFFSSKNSDNKKDFEEMLKANGLAVLYSMARTHISAFSSLSGTQTVNIPMINVYNYIESKKTENK